MWLSGMLQFVSRSVASSGWVCVLNSRAGYRSVAAELCHRSAVKAPSACWFTACQCD